MSQSVTRKVLVEVVAQKTNLPIVLVSMIVDYVGTMVEGKFIRKTTGKFVKPTGITSSITGDILAISQPYVHAVTLLDSHDFSVKHVIGTPYGAGNSSNQLYSPWGLTTEDDLIYIADRLNNRIQVYNLRNTLYYRTLGESKSKSKFSGVELYWPVSITIHKEEIFILEYGSSRISVRNKLTGYHIRHFGTDYEFRFSQDSGIWIDYEKENSRGEFSESSRKVPGKFSGKFSEKFGKHRNNSKFQENSEEDSGFDTSESLFISNSQHNTIEVRNPFNGKIKKKIRAGNTKR